MMKLTVFGIPNCDTVRKARKFLEQHGVDYDFHDVREQPLSSATLSAWLEQVSREQLVNKRSTTWRQLSASEQALADDTQAIALLQAHPTLMKRPVLQQGSQLQVGFDQAKWQQVIGL